MRPWEVGLPNDADGYDAFASWEGWFFGQLNRSGHRDLSTLLARCSAYDVTELYNICCHLWDHTMNLKGEKP